MGALKIRADVASIRCARAMKVRLLKSHMVIPFLTTVIPLLSGGLLN